ncbi:MAG: shikimate kinase [Candidatus Limnocylindria bacterium]
MTLDGECRVLLIGMMGSGKSTIGRLLAEATDWPYVDNDQLVRRSHGTTARQIVAEDGEAQMRSAEADALALGVEVAVPAIIGVAAGTILDEANGDRLRTGGIVVWLRADASILEERAMGADHRPFLELGGGPWIRDAIAERDPLYASVADIVIDTGAMLPQESVAEIVARLRAVSCCHAIADCDQLRNEVT